MIQAFLLFSYLSYSYYSYIVRYRFQELRVGNEHPFNPMVTLLGESRVLVEDQIGSSRLLAFAHGAYLYTPYAISLGLQAQALKEAQIAQTRRSKAHKAKFGYYHSNTYTASYSMGENMPSPYGSYGAPPFMQMPMGYAAPYDGDNLQQQQTPKGVAGHGQGQNGRQSPQNPGMYFPVGPPSPHMVAMPVPMLSMPNMGAGPMDMRTMPIPINGQFFPPMAPGMIPPLPMGYAPPGAAYYQMHNSMASSLSSSYGQPGSLAKGIPPHMQPGDPSPTSQSSPHQEHF
jgi:hypothetical protein